VTLPDLVVIVAALALDLALGDPPNRWHPVAWMGRAIDTGRRWLLSDGRPAWRLRASGAALTLVVAAVAALAAWLVALLARALGPGGTVVEGILLWTLLSIRGLAAAAREVAARLRAGNLAAAQHAVGTHLVSRPAAELDEGQVASAAIESIAENLTDSVLAPLAFYLVFGLPGAAFYRAVNTADAMIGYRDGALEHFGGFAARLDDLLNLGPARLAGLAIALGACAPGFDAASAWRVMWRDHRATASPNAGWTMAAMAGALGVRLAKPRSYRLGDGGSPSAADIARGLRLFGLAAALGIGVLLGAALALK
jgi:adenosylcobinamide-phosphate synthase